MIDIGDFLRVPVRPDCLQHAATAGRPEDGLMAEFGVYQGRTITALSQLFPKHTFHGFDSFVGLPSEWTRGGQTPLYEPGHFNCDGKLPKVPGNVILHKGWFKDTLPPFLAGNQGKVFRLLDIDCDIYISAKQVLSLCNDFIKPGTAIYFDELCDWGGGNTRYPRWEEHEYTALLEWCDEYGRSVRALARNGAYGASVIVDR
jgi:hypothetical protein